MFQKDYYFVLSTKALDGVSLESAIVEKYAMKRAQEIADQTGQAVAVVRVVELIAPNKPAQQSVHSDAGDSAASSGLIHASAESASENVSNPPQRG